MICRLSLVAVLVLAGTSRVGWTAENAQPVNDTLFAQSAAASGMAELVISELGLKQAQSAELKEFSQRMIADHTKMNAELKTLAAQKQIPLPTQLDARSQFCAQSLAGTPSEKFDLCYAKAQLSAHLEAVSAFEAEAERGQDPEVKALAAKALPHLKEHLHMIKSIVAKLDPASAK
jgi:putative membrane protein